MTNVNMKLQAYGIKTLVEQYATRVEIMEHNNYKVHAEVLFIHCAGERDEDRRINGLVAFAHEYNLQYDSFECDEHYVMTIYPRPVF